MKILSILSIVAVSFLAVSQAQAQHNFEQWSGGDGTWDAGVGPTAALDWNGQAYINSIARDTSADPAVSYDYFGSAPGTINVDDSLSSTPVTFGQIEFNSGNQAGNWVFTGDALSDIASDNTATVLTIDGGQTANVTFENQINIAPNPTNGSSGVYNFGNDTTLTLGNINISSTPITYTDNTGIHTAGAPYIYTRSDGSTYTVNSQTLILEGGNGTTTILKGNYTTDPGLYGGMLIGNYGDSTQATATYIIEGGLDQALNGSKQFDFGSGNIVLATSDTGTGAMAFVGNGAGLLQTLLTSGAQTIGNTIYAQSTSNSEIGGSTADVSTYNGSINSGSGGGELDLHAAAGGTVIFNGVIGGDDGATSSSGSGTIVLNSATGNTFTSYIADVFEIGTGSTVQIMNSSGSAFGGGAANGSTPTPLYVQLDSKGTLSGTGTSLQQITAVAADSVIAPGTPTAIGKLTLAGGLVANSGVTLDFKLGTTPGDVGTPPNAGTDNDLIVDDATLSLNGTVTVNFTVIGPVATDEVYTLMEGSSTTADWTGSAPTFNIIAPTGYELDTAYYGTGYDFNNGSGNDPNPTKDNTFTVEFQAVPEPSTYGLLGLGLLALVAIRRFRRLSA